PVAAIRARIAFLRARSLVTACPSGMAPRTRQDVTTHLRETRESVTLVLVARSSVGDAPARSGQARLPSRSCYGIDKRKDRFLQRFTDWVLWPYARSACRLSAAAVASSAGRNASSFSSDI